MSKLIFLYTAALLGAFAASPANSTILTFEDLNPAPALYDLMPATYKGLQFSGWYFGPDTFYTPGSGVIDLFTDYADPADPGAFVITDSNNTITSATPFVFDGANISGYSGVTFKLFLSGSLVATSATLPDAPDTTPYGPTFLASGYGGLVDKVVVRGVQGYYAVDDFTFQPSTDMPEPGSLAIASLGLSLMIFVPRLGRRRKQ